MTVFFGKETGYRACRIEAPCKINLHLEVGEKRSDGYHSLESIFVPLALADTLRFEKGARHLFGDDQLFVDWEIPGECIPGEFIPNEAIPPEKNLVTRAVSLFRERTGYSDALSIRLIKRIPIGAGLGGGSSDAASTLLALNSLAGTALAMADLGEMAALLGSDVPFFLHGGPALVKGRGELMEPVNIPGEFWVVLVKPPYSSDTASSYRLLDWYRERATPERGKEKLPLAAIVRSLEGDPGTWPFYNDFQSLFLNPDPSLKEANEPHAGTYRAILNSLQDTGASFSALSGSGSCCFGIYTQRETAEIAEKQLSGKGNFTRLTFFLARKADPVLE